MPLAANPCAVKAMLMLTVPCAGTLGLVHLLAPRLLTASFGAAAEKSPYWYSDAFMGSVFLAFATTAAVGLLTRDYANFYPLIILQCAYKVYHLLAMVATAAPMDAHNVFYAAGWLAFIAGDVAVFTTRDRKADAQRT